MSYIRHHALLVSSWSIRALREAHHYAVGLFEPSITSPELIAQVSDIALSGINEYQHFVVFPDGSNEDREHSLKGDGARDVFVQYLESTRDTDGYGGLLSWVEVQYGDDNFETQVVRDSDAPRRVSQKAPLK